MQPHLYAALHKLLSKTATATGQAFLQAAVDGFASELDAQFAFVTRVLDNPPRKVRVLAACKDGESAPGVDFELAGTPCEAIYANPTRDLEQPGPHLGYSLIARDVCRLFEPTRNTRYESFIGMPLWSPEGAMIGHVTLFFERPLLDLQEQQQFVDIVRLYCLRVEAELNRQMQDEVQAQLMRELAEANQRLLELSITDHLTGLFNRRHFQDRMRQAQAQHQRLAQGYGLLILDLDHFKAINDQHGHDAGDAVLKQVGAVLAAQTRHDVEEAFRLGGEEFAVLLRGALDPAALQGAAQRLGKAIAEASAPGVPRVTVSIGGVLPNSPDVRWEDVYRGADACLYAAKAAGRNCAVVDSLDPSQDPARAGRPAQATMS